MAPVLRLETKPRYKKYADRIKHMSGKEKSVGIDVKEEQI